MAHLHLGDEHPRVAAAGRGLSQVFWAAVGGIVVAYVFFLALGAFGWGEAWAVTITVIVLGVLWAVHALLTARRNARDPRVTQARERRGF